MEMDQVKQIIARRLLKESSSSEETESDTKELIMLVERENHVKNKLRNVVQPYSDVDFKQHFRRSRILVEELLNELKLTRLSVAGRPSVSAQDSLLLRIWVLSNQESFRSVADRFGFNRGHAHTIFMNMCQLISSKCKTYIKWPRGHEATKNLRNFQRLRENTIPNVFGCVDGTHIPIPGPQNDNSYYNRKGYHSLLLQGICHSKLEFIDVYCGWPGSVNNARMWQNSQVFQKLDGNARDLLPPHSYLIGDSAYPLRTFMMVPYRDNGHLTAKQKKFNNLLSSTRVVIEQAFGRLKGMFRRLKYLNVNNLQYSKYVIFSCCVLHNLSLKEDSVEGYAVNKDLNDIDDDDLVDQDTAVADGAAENMRNDIMNAL